MTSKWHNVTKWSAMKHITLSNRKGKSFAWSCLFFLALFFFFMQLTLGAHIPTLQKRHGLCWRTLVIVWKHFECRYFWDCLLDLLLVCCTSQLHCEPLPVKAKLNTNGLAKRKVWQCLTQHSHSLLIILNKDWVYLYTQMFTACLHRVTQKQFLL